MKAYNLLYFLALFACRQTKTNDLPPVDTEPTRYVSVNKFNPSNMVHSYVRFHRIGPYDSAKQVDKAYQHISKADWDIMLQNHEINVSVSTLQTAPLEIPLTYLDDFYDTAIFDINKRHEWIHDSKMVAAYLEAHLITISNPDTAINYIKMIHGKPFLLVEALDSMKNWRPISYGDLYDWCGNSYSEIALKPGWHAQFKLLKQEGHFKTKLRVKILNFEHIYYSNTFEGTINYTQFDQSALKKDIGKLAFIYQRDSSKTGIAQQWDELFLNKM